MHRFTRRFTVYSTNIFKSPDPLPFYQLPKYLLYSYAGLDLVLLALGIGLTSLAISWMDSNPIHSMVLTQLDLLGTLVVGGLFIATFLLSLPALISSSSLSPKREFSSVSLTFLNAVLVIDQIAVITVGAIIWWRTLQERNTFFQYWEQDGSDFTSSLEQKFNCCGYFTTCASSNGSPTLPVCVDPIQNYADKILNILFTFIFATSSILILLLLCSACIIAELRVLNRYRKIDIKRGKLSAV